MLDCSIPEPEPLTTTIAKEAIISKQNIGDVMRRHGVHPFGSLRSIVIAEVDRLKSINYTARISEARLKAMQRQLELQKQQEGN